MKYKKICPKCSSTNIIPYTKTGISFGEELKNYCKDCYYGYLTPGFFPEVKESELERFREKLKKTKIDV